jgi:photosystem II stability/assembly factor-like uncharacterized protein
MSLILSTRGGLVFIDGGDPVIFQEGADFLALARFPSDGRLCYAARVEGQVFRSGNGGRTWEPAGAIEGFEELSSLAVDPGDPNHLIAGMEPSALFHSRDGGQTWQEDATLRQMARENGWSVPWSDAPGHIRTLAIDPNDPNRVYLAIEVGGVVRTEDGGVSWENVHGGIHDDVHSVAVHPRNGAIVYAATRHGFGRSDDYGRTWKRIDGFEGQGYARPLAVHPQRPERVYTAAATVGPGGFSRPVGSECGVFRSDDGGFTWVRLTNGIPSHFKPYVDAIDVDPSDPGHVALADVDGHLYESRDGGDSWRTGRSLPQVRRLLFTG